MIAINPGQLTRLHALHSALRAVLMLKPVWEEARDVEVEVVVEVLHPDHDHVWSLLLLLLLLPCVLWQHERGYGPFSAAVACAYWCRRHLAHAHAHALAYAHLALAHVRPC